MLCPNCGRDLNKLAVTTNQGGKFEVDHCGYCGGTWFDPYEINRIPFHEVVALAGLTVLPKTKLIGTKSQLCPSDHRQLENFKGEAVPKNVKLLWCRKCLGIWATQKDLLEFKKHQEETISAYDEGEKFFPSLSVVFIPVVTFLFLLITTFVTITSLQKSKDERIYAENQISNITFQSVSPNSLIISFKTASPVSTSISYGISSLEFSNLPVSSFPVNSHSVILTGLKSDTVYFYRLTLINQFGQSFTSDLNSFSTK